MKLASSLAPISSLATLTKVIGLILLTTTSAFGGQETFKLLPGGGAIEDIFGYSVAISGNTAIVGAEGDGDNGFGSGSACLFDVAPSTNYCTAAATSSGAPAVIGVSGTLLVADNDFTLEASALPLGELGYFLMSESTDFVQGFGGSAGNLCLGAAIIRINPSGQVIDSGAAGMATLDLYLSTLPQGAVFLPGNTWYFQFWFRDGATSNTTDGIEGMFL